MAKSLDQLLDFLLEEIALSGEGGLAFTDIASTVDRFYGHENPEDTLHEDDLQDPPSDRVYVVDLAFLEKVWKWLGRHQDVSIGRNHAYDRKPLVNLGKEFPGLLSSFSDQLNRNDDPKPSSSGSGRSPTALNANEVTTVEATSNTGKQHAAPRVYVTETRMFIAICGHPPDPTRVFPSEWQLLSHIASVRHRGILQGDLVRVSGQDKRSVPKRTDALRAKGYIDKQPAYVKGNRTSRLVLRRYVIDQSISVVAASAQSAQNVSAPTVRYQCLQLFDVLKRSSQIIPKDDLVTAMRMTTPGRLGVLNQIIQHFCRTGCIKRTKTAFGPSAQASDLKLCIQWIRDPTETDWVSSGDDILDFTKSIEELSEEPDEIQAQSENVDKINAPGTTGVTEEIQSALTRPLPQWNPDRVLANILFEVTKKHGATGLSNTDARKHITGVFVRRVLESLLMKISHHSLHSQPVGLKHLAIIRAKRVLNGIINYLHFEYRRFEQFVANGHLTWADAEGSAHTEKLAPGAAEDGAGTSVVGQRDQFGFPLRIQSTSYVEQIKMSLTDLAKTSRIHDVPIVAGEPILRSSSSGQLQLAMREASKSGSSRRKAKTKRPTLPRKTIDKQFSAQPSTDGKQGGTGRPRKFMRGTEKFWRDIFLIAKQNEGTASNEEGPVGSISDQAGERFFQARPADFDETLIEAISARLPVPRKPSDISREWIDSTLTLLDPPHDGLFFSLVGNADNRRSTLSKVMVWKSPAIRKIDFNNRKKVWQWQSISSSASHSFRYQKYYPKLGETCDRVVEMLRYSQQELRSGNTPIKKRRARRVVSTIEKPTAILTSDKNIHMNGPPRGVFYEELPTPTPDLAQAPIPIMRPVMILNSIRITDEADTTESDTELPSTSTRRTRLRSKIHLEDVVSPATYIPAKQTTRPLSQHHKSIDFMNSQKSSSSGNIESGKIVDEALRIESISDEPAIPLAVEVLSTTGHINPVVMVDEPPRQETQQSIIHGDQHPDNARSTLANTNELVNNTELTSDKMDHTFNASISAEPPMQSHAAIHKPQELTSTLQQTSQSNPERGAGHTSPSSLQVEQEKELSSAGQNMQNGRCADDETQSSDQRNHDLVILEADSVGDQAVFEHGEALLQSNTPQNRRLSDEALTSEKSLKRKRGMLDHIGEEIDVVHQNNRRKQGEPTRVDITKACRRVLLELLDLCSGVAPCEPSTFRRAMGAKWQETGIRCEPPRSRVVRTNLNNLCQGTKYRRLIFAFQTKAGAMDQKQIIALNKFDITSPEVVSMQEKMKEVEPADYIPPELAIEAQRVPSDMKPLAQTPGEEEQRETDSDVVARPVPRRSTVTARTPKKRKKTSEAREPSPPSSPEPLSLNNGFLTLKIKQLHTLNLPIDNASRYKPPTADQIRSYEARSQRESPAPARPRPQRKPRSSLRTRNITWKKSQQDVLPDSLDKIPNIDLCREEIAMTHVVDSECALFEAEVDCVATWEEKFNAIFDQPAQTLKFINHKINPQLFENCSFPSTIRFESLLQFDPDGNETETAIPEPRSWTPFRNALEDARIAPSRSPSIASLSETYSSRNYGKRKRKDNGGENEPQPKRRRQRRKAGIAPVRQRRRRKNGDDNLAHVKRQRTQVVRHIPQEMRYRVIVSVIIVRTLAGGIEKFINWTLVGQLFPDLAEDYIRAVWKSLFLKYRTDVTRLTENLQERYLEALTDGQVPTVRFDDLAATDWGGIFEWAIASLDKSIVSKIDDLPDTRERFDRFNTFTLNEHLGIRDVLAYGANATQPRKEEVVSSVVFGESIEDSKSILASNHKYFGPSEQESYDPALVRAKSWILAIVLTPATDFKPHQTHTKLHKVAETITACERLLAHAIRSLQRDKVIVRVSKTAKNATILDDNQVAGVRVWEISDKFHEVFGYRRQITCAMLRTAAKYKIEVIDQAMASQQGLILDRDLFLDDGEMLAILNLLAMGMIRIRPGSDKPDTRYGLDWEKVGYTSKLVDKKVLGFSVVITPALGVYQEGDIFGDQRQQIPVPRGEIDRPDDAGNIPLWFDINHTFRPELWEMVVGAVIGLISNRPGTDIKELSRNLNFVLNQLDIGLIVDYLEKLGAIKKTRSGKGWETREWWWMCIAPVQVVQTIHINNHATADVITG